MADTESFISPTPATHKVSKSPVRENVKEHSEPPSPPHEEFRKQDYEKIKREEQRKHRIKKAIPKNGALLDYENMPSEDVNEYREMFKVSYARLAKDNPSMDIVYPGDHVSIDHVHNIYFDYLKAVIAEINAQEYQIYLLVILLTLEIFGSKVMKLPVNGFTEHQMNNFSRYRKYLLEMGEEYSLDGNSSTPVWMRMVFFGMTQLVFFVVIKYLSSQVGNEEILKNLQIQATSFVMDKNNQDLTMDENGVPIPKNNGAFNIQDLVSSAGKLFSNGIDLSSIGSVLSNLTKPS